MSEEEKEIYKVIVFTNGMCAVFDKNGQQMPEFQGVFTDLEPKILEQISKQEYPAQIEKQVIYRNSNYSNVRVHFDSSNDGEITISYEDIVETLRKENPEVYKMIYTQGFEDARDYNIEITKEPLGKKYNFNLTKLNRIDKYPTLDDALKARGLK